MSEKKVSMYDPAVGAFREITLEEAEKYIEGLENLKNKVDEVKDNKSNK